MKIKFGSYLMLALALLTIVIWFIVRQGTYTFDNYNDATYSLGQIAGLTGFVLFSLTFVMTTKLRVVEKAFGGLDKVYLNHHIMGAAAFILLLFHPFLLVLNLIPGNLKSAAIYLLPGSSWPINFGIIALVALGLLIILTLYISMKYQNWKISHKFMGLVYFVALLHIFLIVTDISRYPLLQGYIILMSIVGGVSYLYASWLKNWITRPYKYKINSIKINGRLTLLELSPQNKKMEFKPMQFAFLKTINPAVSAEPHPFTIASSPLSENLRFAIKELGDYTGTLGKLKKGDEVEIDGPYGEFNRFEIGEGRKQVWIAGGIGVTPFLGMLDHIKLVGAKPVDTRLYYCANSESDAVFLGELNSNARGINEIKIIPWYSSTMGRVSAKGLEENGAPIDAEFFICGPPMLMESLSKQLKEKGVPKSRIHMENFNIK
ncbi:MAG: ferric reductase-like transmembrane domain-containing protein [archaeon]